VSGVGSPVVGAVLTGGASSRMGRDKAFVEVDGRLLVAVGVQAMVEAGADPVLVVGGDRVGLARAVPDATYVPDLAPGEGPLGALLTAFDAAVAVASVRDPIVVIVACDMPRLDAATVTALLGALHQAPRAGAALALADGRPQPLTGAWRPQLVVGPMREAFSAGERAPRRVLPRLEVVGVAGLRAEALADVDRPEDLRRYAP
jgi:molybdopterin-guanine dinucleotide biosynthesis protein A